MQKHSISHTGERNFICDICTKSFAYPSSLKQHVLTNHPPIRQYTCELCGNTFNNVLQYSQHKKLNHVESTSSSSHIPETHVVSGNQSTDVETVYLTADDKLLATPLGNQSTNVETVYLTPDDKLLATPLGNQSAEPMAVHVLVNDSALEGRDYENYHSLLISAAANADLVFDNQSPNKQTYQVMCVNPDSNMDQVQSHEVIVQSDDVRSDLAALKHSPKNTVSH